MKLRTFIVVLALIGIITTASAITYVLQTSNSVNKTVTGVTTPLAVTLTSNVTADTMTELDSITLTATTSVLGNGLAIRFFDNGVQVGATQTIALGQASVTLSNLAVGSHIFTAGP